MLSLLAQYLLVTVFKIFNAVYYIPAKQKRHFIFLENKNITRDAWDDYRLQQEYWGENKKLSYNLLFTFVHGTGRATLSH